MNGLPTCVNHYKLFLVTFCGVFFTVKLFFFYANNKQANVASKCSRESFDWPYMGSGYFTTSAGLADLKILLTMVLFPFKCAPGFIYSTASVVQGQRDPHLPYTCNSKAIKTTAGFVQPWWCTICIWKILWGLYELMCCCDTSERICGLSSSLYFFK